MNGWGQAYQSSVPRNFTSKSDMLTHQSTCFCLKFCQHLIHNNHCKIYFMQKGYWAETNTDGKLDPLLKRGSETKMCVNRTKTRWCNNSIHPRPRQEANSGLGSQEVFCLLLNSELHHQVLKSPLSAPILR